MVSKLRLINDGWKMILQLQSTISSIWKHSFSLDVLLVELSGLIPLEMQKLEPDAGGAVVT